MIDRSQYPDLNYFIEQFKTQIRDRFNLECEIDFYQLGDKSRGAMEKKTYSGRTKPY